MADVRHSYLDCIVIHGDFISREHLLGIMTRDVEHWEKLITNELKSLFDSWQLLQEQMERRRGEATLAASQTLFTENLHKWLGFTSAEGFKQRRIELDNDASVVVSESSNHSVVFWDLADYAELELDPFSDIHPLPQSIQCPGQMNLKISLAEWAEKVLKSSGRGEMIVASKNRIFWFRSDIAAASAGLQINIEDAMKPDALEAMAFASYLIRSHTFLESASEEEAVANEHSEELNDEDDDTNEEEDEDESDEGGVQGARVIQIRTTLASKWFQEDLEQQRKVTEELHKQVTIAVEMLVNSYLVHNRSNLPSKAKMEAASFEVFKDGLFFIYRILFVLFAEARGRLPTNDREFSSFYSMEVLLDWCDAFEKRVRMGSIDPNGKHVWHSLRAIFTLLRRGAQLSGQRVIPAFNGQLFAPDQCKTFDNADPIPDCDLVPVLIQLTTKISERRRERLNYANLETAQLGAVYEALLAQRPKYLAEDHVWVESSGKGVGLVPMSWVKGLSPSGTLDYKVVVTEFTGSEIPPSLRSSISSDKFNSFIDPRRPSRNPEAGKFVICPRGGAKRQTASFYTPKKLAEYLAERTLKPLLKACKAPEDVLKLTVLEPSVGCGAFLVAAMKIMSYRLLELAARDSRPATHILGGIFGRKADLRDPDDLLKAKRLIVENCLYGVDTNPLSLELCRVILYLESLDTDRPLPFLHHHLKHGNALLGADLAGRFSRTFAGKKINWAFIPCTNIFRTQMAGKDSLWEKFKAHSESAQALGGKGFDLDKIKRALEDAKKDHTAALNRLSGTPNGLQHEQLQFADWATQHQSNIGKLLKEAANLELQFEEMDKREGGVDAQDAIFRDRAMFLPESDELLLEAWGIDLPHQLVKLRKEAIKRENNQRVYKSLVTGSRASQRLRAFAHLATALHTWPLDEFQHYPKFSEFQKICDILLSTPLSQGIPKIALTLRQFNALRAALRIGQRLEFFHVDLEFPHIMENGGFSACLGNPPWKILQVKDKDAFPKIDPSFLDVKPSAKSVRLAAISRVTGEAAETWWWENHKAKVCSQNWQQQAAQGGKTESQVFLGKIPAAGKIDLCSLFMLRSEGLVRPNGQFGYIVSHSGIFVTKNTTNLRERMFDEMGLVEATVFENRQKIFDIDSRITFAALVASPDREERKKPNFVQGVTEMGDLDLCSALLDGAKAGANAKLENVPLSKELIQTAFSPTLISIPIVGVRREVDFLERLLADPERFQRFGDVMPNAQQGINGTNGPKDGLSVYTELITEKGFKRPTLNELFSSKNSLIPQYKGEIGGLFDPLFLGAAEEPSFNDPTEKFNLWSEKIKQFGVTAAIAQKPTQSQMIGEVKLAWRGISQASNQRTLVPFLCPDGSWGDGNLVFAHSRNDQQLLQSTLALLSSLTIDNVVRYQVTAKITSGVVNGIPLDLTNTKALTRAGEIALSLSNLIPDAAMPPKWKALMTGRERVLDLEKRRELQAELDALIYIHYSRCSPDLTADDFRWMIEHRFKALCKNSPDYVQAVFQAIDRLWPERDDWRSPPTTPRPTFPKAS